jgi:hypothetical protein
MPRYCLLDVLPVEILHVLFTYFLAHEILLTFSDVSDYINDILCTYPTWQLNFQSIRRDHFDLICHRIQPEKVISLTLSDDIDTPGQSELFFRRFRIEQFSHLRSLTLVKIEFESLKDIFSNLDKLEQLTSLSFEVYSITHKYLPSCNSIGTQSRQLRTILLDPYTRVLPRLTRLCLSNGFDLGCIPILQLRHLKLASCQQNELKNIIQRAPFLESLDVNLALEHPNMKITLASSQLTRLRLTILGEYFYICQFEFFIKISLIFCIKVVKYQ